MDYFTYVDGALHCEGVAVDDIAGRAGTPCYLYSRATLVDHYGRLADAFAALDPLICYSIKSCSNLSVCRVLAECGAGMDLVSGGELHRARLAGVEPARCVYAGVGKSDLEIREAIEAGVGWLNVESAPEFERISAVARELGTPCRAALRVNPDVDARTHRYTTTGIKATKFGVDADRARAFFERYGDDPHCRIDGVHVHIGSPVFAVEPYVESIGKILELIDDVRPLCNGGAGIGMLDLGGGFGADYETDQSPHAADYAARLVPMLEERVRGGLRIVLEPGRSIAANAGVLLVRVMFVKESGGKTFVICDGGMNCLIRPSLYQAFHFIWPTRVPTHLVPPRRGERIDLPDLAAVDVVGPICETGDFLALDRRLPSVERGDLLAVFSAGAYGMSMSNRYNSKPLPPEVLVDGDRARVVRRRETYDDLTSHELEAVELEIESVASRRRADREAIR